MSDEVRRAIADAASSVTGIDVSPYFRQTTKAGSGMVRLDRTEYPNKLAGVVTWQVIVLLPQDIATAEKWLDANGSALREAVGTELQVRSLTPQQLAIDTGTVPCVVLEGLREEH
jgi:hypothetical protein